MFLNGVLGLTIPIGDVIMEEIGLIVTIYGTGYRLRLDQHGSLFDLDGRVLMDRDACLRDTYQILSACAVHVPGS
jgi:hypothetical protein